MKLYQLLAVIPPHCELTIHDPDKNAPRKTTAKRLTNENKMWELRISYIVPTGVGKFSITIDRS